MLRGLEGLKPTVLVAATSNWFPTARLVMSLANAGCVVEAVCHPAHPLCSTHALSRLHAYSGLTASSSFLNAIVKARPDLVIPGDDLATRHLHQLHRREAKRGKGQTDVASLIERSLGSPDSFPIVYERASFIRIAEQEGIRVPKTRVISTLEELRAWIADSGLPTVLKADGTSGGDGVRIVRTVQEAEKGFRKLQAPPLLARAAKRALMDHDKTLVWPSLLRRRSTVSAQALIPGPDATSTVACWKGAVMAGLHFEVIKKKYFAGPSTVLRQIDIPEITTAVEKLVRRLSLSGIYGFDFIVETQTGHPYLIEINPRTTQVGHLALGPGRDLPAALAAAVTGSPIQAAPRVTESDIIALFPQEWTRDPASSFIRSAYHDVPWDEPELVRACMESALKQNSTLRQSGKQADDHATLPSLIKSDLNVSKHE